MLPVANSAGTDEGETPLITSGRINASDGDGLESIYNLIPKPKEEKKKPPMYRWSNSHPTRVGIKDGVRSHDPKNYLKCGEGLEARRKAGKRPELPRLEPRSRDEGGSGESESAGVAKQGSQQALLASRRKPAVPRKDERPMMGLKSDKNFLTANAVEAILAAPANRRLPPVDYTTKEDYGRVPEYLSHVKGEIRAENEMVEEFVRQQMGISNHIPEKEATKMPREEQEELVDQLKAKWDDVNARYQQLAHQTFFENGRLQAKARLEKELDEIEAYIAKLTLGPVAVAP